MGKGLACCALLATALVASPAPAQLEHRIRIIPINPPNPPMHNPHGYRHTRVEFPSPEQRAANLAQLLDLSAEQKKQVAGIFTEQDKQDTALWADTALSSADRTRKLDDLRASTVQQIRGLLTEDQRKKYDSIAPAPKPAEQRITLEPEPVPN